MNPRTVILSEIISPYRIPVFNALAQQHEISLHVIFLAETHPSLRKWRVYKDEIRFSYEVLRSWRARVSNRDILLNRGLWPALNAANPDAIICGGYNYPASWEALCWARRRHASFILWSESNQEEFRPGHAWVEAMKQHFLRRCSAFVVPGASSSAYLQHLGVASQNIFTAPNAVDNEYFSAAAKNARTNAASHRQRLGLPSRFILYAGRLVPEKGAFDLVEAYSRLESNLRSKVGLVLAGNGVSREALMERAQQIAPGEIRFPGFLQREDLAVLYSLAEAFVLPSHTEAWGLVVNEAMVCGSPIIITSVAGCAQDLVKDGWNGWVIPPHDPDRLASAVRDLLEQPETREQMAAHSRELIQRFSPADCAQGLAQAVIAQRMQSL